MGIVIVYDREGRVKDEGCHEGGYFFDMNNGQFRIDNQFS